MFKDVEDYKTQRKEIINAAEKLLNEGDIESSNKKMEEVTKLDQTFEAFKKAQANLNALNESKEIKGLTSGVSGKAEKMEEKLVDFGVATPEYRVAFFKKLQGKELTDMENTAVSASSVIPTTTLNKIVEKLEQTSVLYRYITVLNIPNNVNIPTEDATADASWIGMSSASTDSADSTSYVGLAAYKLIKTVEIDADVQAMSIDAFESYVINKLVKKMSRAIENAILNGTNVNQPKGILLETFSTASNLVTLTSTENISWDKTVDFISMLGSEYAQNAVMIMNRKTLYQGFGKVKASTSGVPLFLNNATDGFAGKIIGYPVIPDDLLADDEVLLGDLSAYNWNWAKPIEIGSDSSVGYRKGSTVYRAMALADGELVDKAAFVRMNKSTT